MKCLLCNHPNPISLKGKNKIQFWQCPQCKLTYKDPSLFPKSHEEKHRYLKHTNSLADNGYVNFLSQAVEPTLPFLTHNAFGLDFGCGPSPVLQSLIEKNGYTCELYDPYFFPELPDERKDFIFATECFEHFFEPAKEMQLITSLLIPQGVLSIMTQRWNEETDFSTWWYAQDKTHVLFFHNDTFQYICKRFNFSVLHDDGEKVIVLQKNVVKSAESVFHEL